MYCFMSFSLSPGPATIPVSQPVHERPAPESTPARKFFRVRQKDILPYGAQHYPVATLTWGDAPEIPRVTYEWYGYSMNGTFAVTMGDRGRLVIPAELRERAGLTEGTALTLLETPTGLVLLTRPQLQELVRADLAGLDLVSELLAERRTEAAADDAA
jgi:AbrB family looped-hinge helix DNA binding protein